MNCIFVISPRNKEIAYDLPNNPDQNDGRYL